jgi:hypothetical protein
MQPFQWGPVTAHPRLNYQMTYGNGIQSSAGNQHRILMNEIAPGIALDLGKHWTLDYGAAADFYSDPHFKNTVNQNIQLAGATTYEDWRLGLTQVCSLTDNPSTETGQQTGQQNYDTSLNATYQINSDFSLELGAVQNFQSTDSSGLQNSREWSSLDWLNYQYGPNLGFALGIGGGYVAVDGGKSTNTWPITGTTNFISFTNNNGSDMAYEQIKGRVTFRVTRKINFSLDGGVEFRQFLDTTNSTLVSPLVGATLAYRPFDFTTLSVNAGRTVDTSYFQNQVTEKTSVSTSLNQRLLGRLLLDLSGGYAHTRYRTSDPGNPAERLDDYVFFRVSLGTTFLRRGTASAFYSWSDNSSNLHGFAYHCDQIGAQVGFSY